MLKPLGKAMFQIHLFFSNKFEIQFSFASLKLDPAAPQKFSRLHFCTMRAIDVCFEDRTRKFEIF